MGVGPAVVTARAFMAPTEYMGSWDHGIMGIDGALDMTHDYGLF